MVNGESQMVIINAHLRLPIYHSPFTLYQLLHSKLGGWRKSLSTDAIADANCQLVLARC